MNSNDESKENNPILQFFSNPLIGILGSITSLIGLILAIFFFYSSQEAPDLIYSLHPSDTTLFQSNMPGNLEVLHKGELIQGKDVVAKSFSLWNDGSAAIRKSSILKKIEIYFSPPVQILDANVTKTSRDICDLKIVKDEELYRQGVVPVEWRILEEGDGGNIQIIYAGPRSAALQMRGIIESQGAPREITNPLRVEQKNSDNSKTSKWEVWSIFLFAIIVLIMTWFLMEFVEKIIPKDHHLYRVFVVKRKVRLVTFSLISIVFLFGAAYLAYRFGAWVPPFGF